MLPKSDNHGFFSFAQDRGGKALAPWTSLRLPYKGLFAGPDTTAQTSRLSIGGCFARDDYKPNRSFINIISISISLILFK